MLNETKFFAQPAAITVAAPFGSPLRSFAAVLIGAFCAALIYVHFWAWMKAQYGLNAFLVVTPRDQADFAVWSFVDSRRWLGVVYCILSIALGFSVGRKRNAFVWVSWTVLLVLLAVGVWYWSSAAQLGAKLLK